jgi:DNA repair protein RecN (Recombination protein N)
MRLLNSLLGKNNDFFEELTSLGVDIQDRLDELLNSVERKLNFEIDPSELEGVLERLDLYQRLKRKFGGSVEAILQSQVEFMRERDQLQDLDFGLEKIIKSLETEEKKLIEQAKRLHQERCKKAEPLCKELTSKVRELKMTGASIKMILEEVEDFNDAGLSRAYFIAETNPGEGYHKIKDIASGGELSRILLAVRQILSSCDSISIFLFDEIDTGIGGETANSIGRALKDVSVNGQVIAITHLPQIAQFSDSLIIVNKDSKDDRTESHVKELVGKMIQKEVRAMAQLG